MYSYSTRTKDKDVFDCSKKYVTTEILCTCTPIRTKDKDFFDTHSLALAHGKYRTLIEEVNSV